MSRFGVKGQKRPDIERRYRVRQDLENSCVEYHPDGIQTYTEARTEVLEYLRAERDRWARGAARAAAETKLDADARWSRERDLLPRRE